MRSDSLIKGKVSENIRIGEGIFLLRIEAERKLQARPGQFIMLKVSKPPGLDPLLRRPFAVFDISENSLSILYKVTGRGTKIMSEMKKEEEVDFLGPLGNSFPLCNGKAILVAGGSGIATLNMLGKALSGRGKVSLYYGVKTRGEAIPLSLLSFVPDEFILSTEDGSSGKKGLITDFLIREEATYYMAGPLSMLREISHRFKLKAFASFEERMGCGFGVCMGCGIFTREGRYKRVCVDGPVFPLDEIEWED